MSFFHRYRTLIARVGQALWARHHYTRISASTRLIPEIDGLRFLAVVGVFVCHLPTTLMKHNAAVYAITGAQAEVVRAFNFGAYGVQLFFMISGFILALPFARHHLGLRAPPVRLGRYLLRRLTRLEIPYIVNLCLCCGLLYACGRYDLVTIFEHLGASLGYSHNWLYDSHSIINRVAWSLEIEVQFYLLAPLLTLVFKLPSISRRIIIVAGMFGGVVVSKVTASHPETLLQQAQFFFAGFLLVDLYLAGKLDRAIPQILTLSMALLGIAYLFPWPSGRAILMPWVMFSFGLATFASPAFRAWLAKPWISATGGMCYTIYLYHGVIISGLVQTFFRGSRFTENILLDTLLLLVLAVPVVAFISAVGFRLVERPCMDPERPRALWNGLTAFWNKMRGCAGAQVTASLHPTASAKLDVASLSLPIVPELPLP